MLLVKGFIIIFLFLSSTKVSAQRIQTAWCYPQAEQTLENFLLFEVGISEEILFSEKYLKFLQRWNPTINPKKVRKGSRVYVEIPYLGKSFQLSEKCRLEKRRKVSPKRKVASVRRHVKAIEKKKKAESKGYDISLFYTVSKGSFSESFNVASLDTTQDSPLTLGLVASQQLTDNFSLSESLYFSQLNGAGTGSDDKANIPIEFGGNIYGNFHIKNFSPYLGIDFEKFSTFNTDEIVYGEELSTREHEIIYATLGIGYNLKIFNSDLLFKTSIATTINSSSSRDSTVSPGVNFEGERFIMYLQLPLTDNWSTHILYKNHQLSGATELEIERYGLGIGYRF